MSVIERMDEDPAQASKQPTTTAEEPDEDSATTEVPAVKVAPPSKVETEMAPEEEAKSTSLYNPSVANILEQMDTPEVVKDETATGMYKRVAEELRDDAADLRSSGDVIQEQDALEAARTACEAAQQVIDGLEAPIESENRAAARAELVSAYCNLKELVQKRAEQEQEQQEQLKKKKKEQKRAAAKQKAAKAERTEKAGERRRRLVPILVVVCGVVLAAVGVTWQFLLGPAMNVSDLDSVELGKNQVVKTGYLVRSSKGPVVVAVVGPKWRQASRRERISEVKLIVKRVAMVRKQQVAEILLRQESGKIVARWVKGRKLRVLN